MQIPSKPLTSRELLKIAAQEIVRKQGVSWKWNKDAHKHYDHMMKMMNPGGKFVMTQSGLVCEVQSGKWIIVSKDVE
jgi:hypothetical protein